jgi:hypothetical protein
MLKLAERASKIRDDRGRPLNPRRYFNAWIFRADLVQSGPAGFRAFEDKLKKPTVMDGIPLVKTVQIPAMALDAN